MIQIISLIVIFGVLSAASIVLSGNRGLISGDISGKNFLQLLLDIRFILAMILAVGSRFTFIFINNSLLKFPNLANNSTTITTFVTASSYVFIIAANFLFLNERLTVQQAVGATLVMIGIIVMMR
ncbi:MAG: hypothetical protein GX545_05400 [Fibrobacter sp.]|nr:hypothetical protein [Fibrobacter sp.]